MANGSVPGKFTTQRTMTSTAKNQTLRFAANVPGFRVTTDTPLVTFKKAGETKTVSLTFTKLTTTAIGEWKTGSITWTGADKTRVRIPVALKAVNLALSTSDIDGTGKPAGSADVTVTPGFSGTMSTVVRGLAGTTPVTDTLVGNPAAFDPANPQAGPSVDKYTLTTSNATALRFSADATNDSSDFDLFVYLVNGTTKTLVGVSASGAADEEVTLTTTAPLNGAQLEIYVHQFGGADGSYTYRGWNVDNTAAGNLTVTPASRQVTQGTPVTETIAWTGLAAEQSYFGWVGFAGPSGDGEIAFVEVR